MVVQDAEIEEKALVGRGGHRPAKPRSPTVALGCRLSVVSQGSRVLKYIKWIIKKALNAYPAWVCRKEFRSQVFIRFNERPIEFRYVFQKLSDLYPRTILDVGTGTTALPHLMRNCGFLVTAIDNVTDYWPHGMLNRHYHVIDDDITATRLSEKFDLITCISVLEHIHEPDSAVNNMLALLEPQGHLILTFPYSERSYVRNVYELPGSSYGQRASYTTQSYSREDVRRWVDANGATIVDQEYWQCWNGEYWTVGEQVIPPKRVGPNDRHQLTCLLLQKG